MAPDAKVPELGVIHNLEIFNEKMVPILRSRRYSSPCIRRRLREPPFSHPKFPKIA